MGKWTVIICQVTFSKLTLLSDNQTHPQPPNFWIFMTEKQSHPHGRNKKLKFRIGEKNKEILLRNPWEKIGERAWALVFKLTPSKGVPMTGWLVFCFWLTVGTKLEFRGFFLATIKWTKVGCFFWLTQSRQFYTYERDKNRHESSVLELTPSKWISPMIVWSKNVLELVLLHRAFRYPGTSRTFTGILLCEKFLNRSSVEQDAQRS